MSIFHSILLQFNRLSLTEKSKVQQQQMVGYLNKLAKMNTNLQRFDSDIGQQLWQHSNQTPEGKVLIKDYIQTVIDARNILSQNLAKCQVQASEQCDPQRRQQIEDYLQSYKEDLQVITDTFQLNIPSSLGSAIYGHSVMKDRQSREQSGIFDELPSSREQSSSLKWTLILTIVMLCLQFLCMQVRDHFMNLIVYTAIVCIFFLGYFDRTYIKAVLLMLSVAILLDLAWLILMAPFYWYPSRSSLFSTIQGGFLIIVYTLTALLMLGKMILIILLFKFRKNDFMTKKSILLDGKDTSNPITSIFGDSGSTTKSYD